MTDAQTIGLDSKVLIPKGQQLDMSKHQELDELGIPKSIEYVEDIQVDYPHTTITTTDHCLGEYIALYIAAEYKIRNVGFNGPDLYNILFLEENQ